eukprot:299653-Pyramimonas_sp.AAC.1
MCSIRPDANPWALRVHADIEQLVLVSEEAADLWREARCRVKKLFDPEFAARFRRIDVTILRSASLSVNISPTKQATTSLGGEEEEAGALLTERMHTCFWEDESGPCGATFSSKSGLANHIRIVHNSVKLSHALTLTNQCIVCEEVFGERLTACKHLEGALQHGRCLRNKASTLAELTIPLVM